MEISQRIYNGDRALEILDNEAFTAAFVDIEREILEQWKQSPARDQEGREKLWLMLSLLSKLKTTLETSITTGKLAKLELKHQRSIAERVKDARLAFSDE